MITFVWYLSAATAYAGYTLYNIYGRDTPQST